MTLAPEPRPPAPHDAHRFLDGLNAPQREAVLTTEGPVLMLAGAGTGKTRALTTRLAYILASRLARPGEILAVTFTNKAAREMRERIRNLIGDAVEGMRWLGTFHSIGAQIVRMHAECVGLKAGFTIIDSDDQLRLCRQVLEAAGLDDKRWPARGFAAQLDDWKNRGLSYDQMTAEDRHAYADGRGVELYRAYQRRLIELNAADFGDLLLHNLHIFEHHPAILANYHQRFKYILVDEYQDTNLAQYKWLRFLTGIGSGKSSGNICVVGDDDQSIYGWRGAQVENILRFERDFTGARVIRLEQNYRSTPSILAAASALIDKNEGRLGKTLWTENSDGRKIMLRGVWDADEEARSVSDDIESEQRQGRPLADIAILVRAAFQMRAFEERFNTLGIPYQVIGGPRFYEREESRDALAYLRLVRNPDDDLSFIRIVNKPRRGLGDGAMQTLSVAARKSGLSMRAAAQLLLETDELKGRHRNQLIGFLGDLDRWRAQLATMPPADLAGRVLDESGYTDLWRNTKTVQAEGKLENLKELVRAVGEFETLESFLDHVSLVAERTEASTDGQVWLMTLHASKGLEFPVVFLPGWEEEIFPSGRSINENGKVGLEEERRLAYVGITRARESCRISYASNRIVYGRWQSSLPSRFIDELPPSHVEVAGEAGLYGVKARELAAFSRFETVLTTENSGYDTPGWRRARNSSRRPEAPSIEGTSSLIASSVPGSTAFRTGARVTHATFGTGTVVGVEGNKLAISFDDHGLKRVVASFVSAA